MAPGRSLVPCLALLLGLAGCRNPACRVSVPEGRKARASWLAVPPKSIGWFQNQGIMAALPGRRVFMEPPDLALLCEGDCAHVKEGLARSIEARILAPLRRSPSCVPAQDPASADLLLRIKLVRVMEPHYIEYLSYTAPRRSFTLWARLVDARTGATAAWIEETLSLGGDDPSRTFGFLVLALDKAPA